MEKRKIVLVCDDDRLLKIILLAFDKEKYQIVICDFSQPIPCPDNDFQSAPLVIVVALASPMSEPIVEISRAQLGMYIGKIPILIVSQRKFYPAKSQKIYQMDFPFDIVALKKQVELLSEESLFTLGRKQ